MESKKNKLLIITFNNTLEAIKGEKVLKDNLISVTIMPTPTIITKSCGISIKFEEKDSDHIKELIDRNKLKVKGLYYKEGIEYKVLE